MTKVSETLLAYEKGLDEGVRYGWIESLDYVLTVLNEEVDYQEESAYGTVHTISALYRIIRIMDHRRKEWTDYQVRQDSAAELTQLGQEMGLI